MVQDVFTSPLTSNVPDGPRLRGKEERSNSLQPYPDAFQTKAPKAAFKPDMPATEVWNGR